MQIGVLGSLRRVITYRLSEVVTFFELQDQSGEHGSPSQEFLGQCARDRLSTERKGASQLK
jgi:hypothetical protein